MGIDTKQQGRPRPARRATVRALATFLRCPERARIELEAGLRLAGGGHRPWPPRLQDAVRWALGRADLARVARMKDETPAADVVQVVRADAMIGLAGWASACRAGAPSARFLAPPADEQIAEVRSKAEKIVDRALRVLPWPVVLADRADRPILHQLVDLGIPGPTGRPSGCRVVVPLDGIVEAHGLPWAFVRHFTNTVEPADVRHDLPLDLDLRPAVAAASAVVMAETVTHHRVAGAIVEVIRLRSPSEIKALGCRRALCRLADPTVQEDPPCPDCAGTNVSGLSTAAVDSTIDEWEATLARYPHLDPAKERFRAAILLGRLRERGESFSYRVEVPVDSMACRAWASDVRSTFRLLTTARRVGFPRNPGACDVPPCPYRAVCANRLDPNTAPFQRVDPGWMSGTDPFLGIARRFRWAT
jgi:hypothetical protein